MVRRQEVFVIYGCAINVFSDLASRQSGLNCPISFDTKFLIVMALPLAMLKGLQMRTPLKIGLAGVFCCAFITIAFDVLRAVETDTKGGVKGSTALWTNLESAVAVIVSCLPSLTALFSPKNHYNGIKNRGPYRQRSLVISNSAKVCMSAGSSAKSGNGGRASAAGESVKDVIDSSNSIQEPAAHTFQSQGSSVV